MSKMTIKRKNLYKPLKDLKGSSVWKGSAGGSLTLLLLNMAIFDLKDSPWSINKKDFEWTQSLFLDSPNRLNKHVFFMDQGNTPGALRTTGSERLGILSVFMASQRSQQVNKNKVIHISTLKRKHLGTSHHISESPTFLLRNVFA